MRSWKDLSGRSSPVRDVLESALPPGACAASFFFDDEYFAAASALLAATTVFDEFIGGPHMMMDARESGMTSFDLWGVSPAEETDHYLATAARAPVPGIAPDLLDEPLTEDVSTLSSPTWLRPTIYARWSGMRRRTAASPYSSTTLGSAPTCRRRAEPRQACREGGQAGVVVANPEGLTRGAKVDVEMLLGHIDTDEQGVFHAPSS